MLRPHVQHTMRISLVRSVRVLKVAQQAYSTRSSPSNSTRPCAKPRALETAWYQQPQRRGAKKKATVELGDILQGVIAMDELPPQDDAEPDYPPLLQQVRNNMLKFNHCVLVTRVGGFYEVYESFSVFDSS